MYFCLPHLTLAGLRCRCCGQNNCDQCLKTDVETRKATVFLLQLILGTILFPPVQVQIALWQKNSNVSVAQRQTVLQKVKALCLAEQTPHCVEGQGCTESTSCKTEECTHRYTRASPSEFLSRQAEWALPQCGVTPWHCRREDISFSPGRRSSLASTSGTGTNG